MKFLLITLLLSRAALSFDLTDYAVFSKTNIHYAKSDFEGRTGAGGSVTVKDFLFTSARTGENGLIVGRDYVQVNGGINAVLVKVSNSTKMTSVAANGITDMAVFSTKAQFDGTYLPGTVHAHQIVINNSGVGQEKKLSLKKVEKLKAEISREVRRASSTMDRLSAACSAHNGIEGVRAYHELLLTSQNDGVNYFTLTSSDLAGIGSIVLEAKHANTDFVINVSGEIISIFETGVQVKGALAPDNILWNFSNTKSLVITSSGGSQNFEGRGLGFPGTILAPQAKVTLLNLAVTGAVYANDLLGSNPNLNGGQVNYRRYEGDTCGQTTPSPEDPSQDDPNQGDLPKP